VDTSEQSSEELTEATAETRALAAGGKIIFYIFLSE
jgi:hypothetical protein